jgi:hypothetical protein
MRAVPGPGDVIFEKLIDKGEKSMIENEAPAALNVMSY